MVASGFEVHTTAYGPPASSLLSAEIAALKGGDVLAPVTVVVPSDYAGISARRALAERPGGVASVTFTTLARVAERLAGPHLAAAGRRPVSGPVLAGAVRKVLATDAGRFAPVREHSATELALVSAHRELAGLGPAALEAVAGAGAMPADVVRVSAALRAELEAAWYDERDLLLEAAELVDGPGVGGQPIVVHLLQHLSYPEAALLAALGRTQAVVVNVGLSGDADADRSVIDAHARAGIEVRAGEEVRRPTCSSIVSVSDPDEEARAAVRLVAEWMRQGVPLGQMAVVYGTADPYARLLHEHLEAAGIPHSGDPVRALGDMLLGRTVRGLLRLPERDYRRSDVLGLITGSGLLDGEHPAPGRAWQRVSREAGVVSGTDWSVRLAAHASDQRRRAERAARDEDELRAGHLRRDAERTEALSSFVARLRAEVEGLAAAGTWREMAGALLAMVGRWVSDDRRRGSWPHEDIQAAERVEEVIERLAALDELGGEAPTVEVFRRALEVELEAVPGRVGRLGGGVLTVPVGAALGVATERLVVVGLAEGSFPPRRLEDSLLPDDCRRRTGGELGLRADRHHDDHRLLMAAVASSERAVLLFPRGDLRRRGDRPASRWLLDDAAALAGRESLFTADLAGLSVPWLTTVPSYAAGVASTPFPATDQDVRLAVMLADEGAIVGTDPVVRSGTELARARRSGEFTRFDGNLGGLDLPDYTAGGVTSATRLQEWAKCPHAFLMNHLLGVEVVDEPEKRLEMSPLDRGTLVHAVLEHFVAEQIAAGGRGPWPPPAVSRLEEIAEEVFESFEALGRTGRGSAWRHDRERIRRDLLRFAAEDGGCPVGTEVHFDDAAYRLPDGREVRFRGSIDRVDEPDPERLVVLDYKTGSTRSYRGLSADDPHQGGTHLQLAVYAAAARQERGDRRAEAWYWFVTDKGGFERIGYPVTDDVHDRVGAAITTIVDGIRAGVFPRRPPAVPAYGWVECWYCSPDGLSTAEARRDWERKRVSPELDSYLRLVEPDATAADA